MVRRTDEKCKKHYGSCQLPKVQNWGKIDKDQPYHVEPRAIENSSKGLYDFSNPDKTYQRTQTNDDLQILSVPSRQMSLISYSRGKKVECTCRVVYLGL